MLYFNTIEVFYIFIPLDSNLRILLEDLYTDLYRTVVAELSAELRFVLSCIVSRTMDVMASNNTNGSALANQRRSCRELMASASNLCCGFVTLEKENVGGSKLASGNNHVYKKLN